MKKLCLVATALVFIFSGCTKHGNESGASKTTKEKEKVVNLAIWSNYVSPEVVTRFEKQYGIKVQMSNYSSNEELLAKLQAGASGYDVAVPSDYMVLAMSKLNLLEELDYKQLTNAGNVDNRYLKKNYDPVNKYSLPYDWGTTGIAINYDIYKGQMKGWKDFFSNATLSGRFSLLDDARETIGAALKELGFSLNSKNPTELEQAKKLLLGVRGRIKAFTSEAKMPLINGELGVAHTYVTDALQANQTKGGNKISYIIPEEGGTFWIDNLVIPKGALHSKEAHQLINFLLEAKSNVSTSLNIFVAPATRDALPLLPKEFRENTGLFPPDSVLSKCEMIEDLGDSAKLWDRIWTEVKAQQD